MAIFQELKQHMWLLATIDSTDMEYFDQHRKFNWSELTDQQT